MCGFIGCFKSGGRAHSSDLAPMAHRGPDGFGEWRSPAGDCWLGHVRLAILELGNAGAQPMLSASGRTAIVFNGEIYNHLEVRKSIRSIPWRGHSDTETLVEAWEQIGERCLESLRGMFAFAVYDLEARELYLVRDRLGIKPVYFRQDHKGFSFASEVHVLNGGRRPALGEDALNMFLATGHLSGEGEVGEGIRILPPGCKIRISAGGRMSQEKWWPKVVLRHSQTRKREELLEEVRRLVESSVSEHLLADVPVAVFLSGGTDSSVIATAAAKAANSPLRTFTVGFPQIDFDERPIAKLVAERLGSKHHEIEVSPQDCIRWIGDAVAALDLPSADAVNSFIVSRVVRDQGLKVALSGLGGDEVFGGYPSFRDVPRLRLLGCLPEKAVRKGKFFLPEKIRAKLEGNGSFDAFSLALARRRWWSRAEIRDAGIGGSEMWPLRPVGSMDSFAMVSWAEILGYMEPMLLRDCDQMSMAASMELRVPFLDHRLVEFGLAVPESQKRGIPKKLLVDAFARDLPIEVWDRPRAGFVLPMDDWMRGPLADFCSHGLDASKSRLNAAFVDRAFAKFQERRIHWTRVWQLVVLGHYLEKIR
ncbi:MAG: asparagine synthase (glutamine-hydrolyzing) [Verrucomicrobia bacterium]|nr:asparagine synthase (glutamine-hydrolyzing) [Verrucomicrobiota bacterium]